jgi:hypothetical protein
MTRLRLLLILGILLILLLAGVGAAWWYLFGANSVAAQELVPGDTLVFATIPNAATIATGYQTSQLKTLVDSPNTKPLTDAIVNEIGPKNMDLLNAFLPNLSGQSFIALTHVDPDNLGQTGFIAGMKPKAGLGDFNGFVDKLKAAWPDVLKQGTTGTGNVAGVDYQWIKGPGAADKICVAQVQGWILTTWGEASLQDGIERLEKKSATPSLAQNPDFQKSLAGVGKDPMTLLYLNYHAGVGILQKQLQKMNPAQADYLGKKLSSVGGAAIGTRFENGEIVDRFSVLMPHQAQLDSGVGATPCPFETLNFTGPDTRLYLASSIDWKQYYKNLQEQMVSMTPTNPAAALVPNMLQTLAQGMGLDIQHNLIDPLGSEFSIQVEWSADAAYPEAGLFVKLDKPDDFQPTIKAIIEAARKAYETTAVVDELTSGGRKFAALKFVQASPITPTITEDGPYLGLFLTENQAVRSFQRDATITLLHNADFNRQIGDKRNGASEIIFLDTPQLLDRGYRTALPYLSLASMFSPNVAAYLKDKNLPSDLTWLAPMGTWSMVVTPHDDSIDGYSVSGIGNQGILLGASLGGTAVALQSMGLIPNLNKAGAPPSFPGSLTPPPAPVPAPPASSPPEATSPAAPPAMDSGTSTNAPPAAASGNATNAPPSDASGNMTNAPPVTVPPTDSTTNAPPSTPAPAPSQ